ncbi:hypothetical protein LXA43DRAFT_1054125, partial [Ganoderma leucocontextum]
MGMHHQEMNTQGQLMNADHSSGTGLNSPRSSMLIEQSVITRALFCQDIVELIFDNLSLHSVIYDPSRGDNNRGLLHVEDQCEKRRTLALAARVSKHISEVALSVLWAQLKGFRPLFRLLPQYSLHTWNIEGKPTDADWTRLEKYTRLVREICMFPMDSEGKCWEIFRARYRTIGHFLPRLMALATVRITPVDPLFDFHLLPPTLRHLSMALYRPAFSPYNLDDSVLLTAAMEQLASAIPSLSSLKISDLSWETPQPEISWKMASFKCLRKLDITPHLTADAPILATISQFQHLHALSVHISADCAHLHGCFQALTELSIGGRAAHIQSFLTATSPPLLRSLSLFFLHDPSTEAVLQCLSVVPSAVPTVLTALALECKLALHPKIPAVMDVVQPMLAFRALTRFTFSFKPLPSIGDDEIVTMLSAWPALNALRIEHDYV